MRVLNCPPVRLLRAAIVSSMGIAALGGCSSEVQQQTSLPTANFGGGFSAVAGTQHAFNGGMSTDAQGQSLSYAWNFGDGSTAVGIAPTHTYLAVGSVVVSLMVTEASGSSSTTDAIGTIAPGFPVAEGAGPYAGSAGALVSFNGAASNDPQGETLRYAWSFGDGRTATVASPSHAYAAPGNFAVSLTVTDTSNLSATAASQAVITPALPPAPATGNRAMAGMQPIANSSIQLYAVGTTGVGSAAVPLLAAPAITGPNGSFSIAGLYTCPSPGAQIYITATGGNPGLAAGANNASIQLMAALGPCASLSMSSAFLTIDEVSTVEAVWPASAYMVSASQVGAADARSLSNAFVDSANLAGIVSGTPAYPGTEIVGQDLAIRSLANSLNACTASDGDVSAGSPCGLLFAATTTASGAPPPNTASAALAIALNPTADASVLFGLGEAYPIFQPALTAPPGDWSLSLPQSAPATFRSALNTSTVFMGDSITQFWPLPVNNAGVAGQHASDMFARFSADVIGHGYARVIILAGTNDVWSPTPISNQAVEQIAAMAQMATAAGIEVVLCDLPPMSNDSGAYLPAVVAFNAALSNYAITNGYLLVDYFTPMAGHPEYFLDGVHPNPTGYAVMQAALSSVVEQ